MAHKEKLAKTVLNEGAYANAIHELKAAKPSKAELVQIVAELTGLPVLTSATIKDLYRRLEQYGASERRHEARAEISHRIIPA